MNRYRAAAIEDNRGVLSFFKEDVSSSLGLPLLFRVDIDVQRLGGGTVRSYASWPFQSGAFYRRLLERWRETNGRVDLAGSVLWIAGFAGTAEYRPWSIGLADQLVRAGVRPYLLGDTIAKVSTARFSTLALSPSVAARAEGLLPKNACWQGTDLEGVRLVISSDGHVATDDEAEDKCWALLLSAPVPGTGEEITRRFHNVDAVVLAVAFRDHSVDEIKGLIRAVRAAGLPILGLIGIAPPDDQRATSPLIERSDVARSSATQASVERTNGVAPHPVPRPTESGPGVDAVPRDLIPPKVTEPTAFASGRAKRNAKRAAQEAARRGAAKAAAEAEAARLEAKRAAEVAAREAALDAERLETERAAEEAARQAKRVASSETASFSIGTPAIADVDPPARSAPPDELVAPDATARLSVVLAERVFPAKPRRSRAAVLAIAVIVTAGAVWIGLRLSTNRGGSDTSQVAVRRSPPPALSGVIEEKVVTPSEPVVTPANVSNADDANAYVLQLAAFRIRTEAEAELARLAGSGIPVRIVLAVVPKRGRWYRVVTGNFKTLDEANAGALALQRTQGIAGALVCTEGGRGALVLNAASKGQRGR